jgi:Ca2+-binding EF-hand superfamily protein
MKIVTLGFLFIAAMLSTAAFGGDTNRMDAAETMAIADKNGDHHIDREEYYQRMTEVFFFIDTDKDGSLTEAEIEVVEKMDPRRFEAADRDKNHSLSLDEYQEALSKDFEEADRNKDGTLDMEELRLMMGK